MTDDEAEFVRNLAAGLQDEVERYKLALIQIGRLAEAARSDVERRFADLSHDFDLMRSALGTIAERARKALDGDKGAAPETETRRDPDLLTDDERWDLMLDAITLLACCQPPKVRAETLDALVADSKARAKARS